MARYNQKAVTLLELLVAIVLLSVVSMGFVSIELFSRNQLENAQRRSKIQNEASLCLDHISKNLAKAIGNIVLDHINDSSTAVDIIETAPEANSVSLRIYVDGPKNAPDGARGAGDYRVAYMFRNGNYSTEAKRYNLEYCDNFVGNGANTYESIANHITNFSVVVVGSQPGVTDVGTNAVELNLTACWDPAQAKAACGTSDNPSVTMQTRVLMPMVSNK